MVLRAAATVMRAVPRTNIVMRTDSHNCLILSSHPCCRVRVASPGGGVPGREPAHGVPGREPAEGVPGREPATDDDDDDMLSPSRLSLRDASSILTSEKYKYISLDWCYQQCGYRPDLIGGALWCVWNAPIHTLATTCFVYLTTSLLILYAYLSGHVCSNAVLYVCLVINGHRCKKKKKKRPDFLTPAPGQQ